jgi:hypothetical protein
MVTRIGIVSGEIITFLEEVNRPLVVGELEFFLEEPHELILMSLGWLARQGIIHIEKRRDEYVVFLVGPEMGKRILDDIHCPRS